MSTASRLENRYFLVVDDEEFVRSLVVRFLNRSGAAGVVEAADGREAIAAIASYDMVFDAIVSDVRMRPMNGIELLRAIRTGAGGLKRNIPVVMLTAHAEAELVDQALALDADAFVVKPVKREALIERVLRVLQRAVPIQPAANYAAVGSVAEGSLSSSAVALDAGPESIALASAPPTKDLYVSIAAFSTPSLDAHAASGLVGAAARSAVAMPRKVALGKVKANSILAQNIYIADTPRLLLAAPTILTTAMLDRLKDLRAVHDGYSHVYVIEPGEPASSIP
jgi:CheY-like chemotaxis protein